MSKASLKKELATLSKPQLEQLILDAYSARKEIKEYLEYFLDPRPEEYLQKAVEQISKECQRSKWGRSKARATVIRKAIDNFASLQPGEDMIMKLHFKTLQILLSVSGRFYTSDTHLRAFIRIAEDYIRLGDSWGCVSEVLDNLKLLEESDIGSPIWHRQLSILRG